MENYNSMVSRLLFDHILVSMRNTIAWLVGYFLTTFWYQLTHKSCRNLEGPWDSLPFLVGHGICAQKEVAIHLGKLKQQGGSTYKIWQVISLWGCRMAMRSHIYMNHNIMHIYNNGNGSSFVIVQLYAS
jgi:hypothetical protein